MVLKRIALWALGFLALAALVLAAQPLMSQAAHAKGFYVTGFGGANWDEVDYDFGWMTVEADTGSVLGVAVGTTLDGVPGLRVEGELSFRSNDIDVVTPCETLAGYDRTWALMGNAVYDFETPTWPVHPYALLGVGYASREGGLDQTPFALSNQGFAWQLGAGVNTKVAEGIVVGAGYRFFDAPDLKAGGVENDGHNHSVLLTASFLFN